ncbi:Hypothetical protein CAP_1564 [Chondromyces apiculatus DSM 436]|uniref:Uncharacterized protein n=2 Tax=Chondromyces apiculatus TaxID=51 RepID=A0A017TD67_9BACT|nr:Hypothetical protein CAP_1564 [Chondromyces apiculatus DSM 436]
MVRQFADPYAFLRELVQNSLDAGASRVEVRVERARGGLTFTAALDDGQGMGRETIEGPLLTLFSSSKEGVEGKIGKYGIGFVSVFAIGPDAVEVETWRDGQAFRLVLRPDTSYTLEDAGAREGRGTRVTLHQQMDDEAFHRHVTRVRGALSRWCRHADRPITLAVVVDGTTLGGAGYAERIDVPFAVDAAASVTVTEGDMTVAVGPLVGSQHLAGGAQEGRFAGFYNRGLTLFETSEEMFPGLDWVRFKAMSPRFQHTLSRDNVRRDEAFREALRQVGAAVRGPLKRAIAERLGPAAEAAAQAAAQVTAGVTPRREVGAYLALVEAALAGPTRLDPAQIPFPLAHPVDGRSAVAGLAGLLPWRAPLLVTDRVDALTAALARQGTSTGTGTGAGTPIVLLVHPAVRQYLARCYPRLRLAVVQEEYLRVVPEQKAAGDGSARLVGALLEALARARHEVAGVVLCRVEGTLAERAGLLLPEAEEAQGDRRGGDGRGGSGLRGSGQGADGGRVVAVSEVGSRATRFKPTDTLYLNVKATTVALARDAAEVDAVSAAALLARALILEARGPLDEHDVDQLLDVGRADKAGQGAPRRSS